MPVGVNCPCGAITTTAITTGLLLAASGVAILRGLGYGGALLGGRPLSEADLALLADERQVASYPEPEKPKGPNWLPVYIGGGATGAGIAVDAAARG